MGLVPLSSAELEARENRAVCARVCAVSTAYHHFD